MSFGAREEDKDRIVGSLEMIIQALLGQELGSLRLAVNELGNEMKHRIEALREETKGSLETLRDELRSADDSVQQELIHAVETRVAATAQQAESQIEALKHEISQELSEVATRLQNDHLAISERLGGAERELTRYETTSGRITQVLDTLGNVLSREDAARTTSSVSAPQPADPIDDHGLDHDGVVTEVRVPLPGSGRESEIETQPIPATSFAPDEKDEVEGALDRVALLAGTPGTPRTTE